MIRFSHTKAAVALVGQFVWTLRLILRAGVLGTASGAEEVIICAIGTQHYWLYLCQRVLLQIIATLAIRCFANIVSRAPDWLIHRTSLHRRTLPQLSYKLVLTLTKNPTSHHHCTTHSQWVDTLPIRTLHHPIRTCTFSRAVLQRLST